MARRRSINFMTIATNIIFTGALCIINRTLFLEFGVPSILVTFLNAFSTSIGLQICERLKLFQYKHISVLKVFPVSLIYCGFLAFTSFSLERNFVGSHILTETLTTPFLLVIQTHFYKKTFIGSIKLITIVVTGGILLSYHLDLGFNLLGLLYGAFGYSLSCLYQLWISEHSGELRASTMQVLFYISPLSTLYLLIILPILLSEDQIFTPIEVLPAFAIVLLISTMILSFCVSISTYHIVQKTSPVTYSMLGHIKSCSVLLLGFLVFWAESPILQTLNIMTAFSAMFPVYAKGPNFINILGITATLSGVAAYTYIRQRDRGEAKKLPVDIKKKIKT